MRIAALPAAPSKLPEATELCASVALEFARLDQAIAEGTIEQKRELIGCYAKMIKADRSTKCVEISLYSALFSRNIAGGGFEPPTSGL